MVLPLILLGHEEINKGLVFIRIPYTTLDPGKNIVKVKSSRNKKDLNEVTAVPFLVVFCCWQLRKRHRKRGSCDVIKGPSYFVTTLPSFEIT